MISKRRAYIELHIAVILFGFTAILGAVINISAAAIVTWRVVLAFAAMAIIVNWPSLKKISKSHFLQYLAIGTLVAAHWLCFYGAVKLSNASITLVCLATTALFTSLIEPLMFRRRPRYLEVLLGLVVIPAMLLIVNSIDKSMIGGVCLGLMAAFFVAIFTSWNKKLVDYTTPKNITFIELGSAAILLTIALPLYHHFVEPVNWIPHGMDWVYMAIFVILCTNLAYLLSVRALKKLSAFTANLVINLEPVYGIVLAYFLLSEHKELNIHFYVGCAIIILAILLHGLLKKKE